MTLLMLLQYASVLFLGQLRIVTYEIKTGQYIKHIFIDS